jgi:nicotinate-nucleotide--dimethylbenzimidazole phosphoribosyltransferase
MAADNGVEAEGVSASKRVITQYVVEAMLKKEASISSLAKTFGSDVFVVDLGIDSEKKFPGIIDRKVMKNGTKNIRVGEAMTREEAIKAIEAGIETVDRLVAEGYNLFAIGEMGIANTTTSSAILRVLTDLPLNDIVGKGSGICDEKLELKKQVIMDAISVNSPNTSDPIEVLHKLGGLDIAAMTGAYLGAAKNRAPVIIDGLISGVSALLASLINPKIKEYMLPSHIGEEPGIKWIMKNMELEPMLFMNMKLGEGSGAVLMFPIVEAASNIARDIRLYPEV